MSIQRLTQVTGVSNISWEHATEVALASVNFSGSDTTFVVQDQIIKVDSKNVNTFCITAMVVSEVVNHKSIVTYMKAKSKSHAAPAVKKAAPKKAAKKAAAKKAAPKKAAAKKAAPKKAAKKAAPKKAAKKAAPKKAAKKAASKKKK
jgi:hypothetical protein